MGLTFDCILRQHHTYLKTKIYNDAIAHSSAFAALVPFGGTIGRPVGK
jgi:hypothetical protein